jgi:hypothetical protein
MKTLFLRLTCFAFAYMLISMVSCGPSQQEMEQNQKDHRMDSIKQDSIKRTDTNASGQALINMAGRYHCDDNTHNLYVYVIAGDTFIVVSPCQESAGGITIIAKPIKEK